LIISLATAASPNDSTLMLSFLLQRIAYPICFGDVNKYLVAFFKVPADKLLNRETSDIEIMQIEVLAKITWCLF
jgi:hypothetical protein